MAVGINKAIEATEAAKAAVDKIEKAVRREVITPDKLVRTPASDLYDKSFYMNTERFWKDNDRAYKFLNRYVGDYRHSNEYGKAQLDTKKAEIFEPLRPYIEKMRKLAQYKENL